MRKGQNRSVWSIAFEKEFATGKVARKAVNSSISLHGEEQEKTYSDEESRSDS
jgi:hypothetical protein